ncbi:hypothetical protein P8C59_006394 [Phyllachora maydis]|uniref:Uncharacterized protein n=1 Tax=Phyllachora maydis TaxID=1825666 RepID=A0AAD9MGN7_9PEZI|nr:hypothetical protein P8C59_006394 [Phyllachora maydis]
MLVKSYIIVSNLLVTASTANATTVITATTTTIVVTAATTASIDPPAPIPAKPAKITPAIRCIAACKAKQRKSAKACTIVGRAAAAKRPKKEGLQRSKRTANSNASRYTTDSSLVADKNDNNAYNRAYIPPTDIEEEEGSSSNNDSINGSTSNSTDKVKGSSIYKHSKGTSRYKDMLLYKRQYVISYPCSPPSTPYADIYVYYI